MKKTDYVITIGREFCSAGSDIGSKIADYFNIPYYDKKIIDKTADLLHFNSDVVAQNDEKDGGIWDSFAYQYGDSLYAADPTLTLPIGIQIADAQFSVIQDLAKQGPCVIVGRCSNIVLKDIPNAVHIFITANNEDRIERAMRLYDLSPSKAKKLIKQTDKVREGYYSRHTGEEWGDPNNYNLVVNSAKLGEDATASVIESFIEKYAELKKTKL